MTVSIHEPGQGVRTTTVEEILCENGLVAQAGAADTSVRTIDDIVARIDAVGNSSYTALDHVASAFVESAHNLALVVNPDAFVIVARYRAIAEYFAARLARGLDTSENADRFNVTTVIPLEYDPILACRGAADLVFSAHFADATE